MVSWFAGTAAVLLGFVGGSIVCQAAHGDDGRLPGWMKSLHLGLALLTAVLFLIAFLTRGLGIELLAIWLFVMVLLAVSVFDLERLYVPARALVFGSALAVLLAPRITDSPWWIHVCAGLATAGILYLLMKVPAAGVGAAEVELGLFVGAALGELVIVSFLTALAVRGVALMVLPRTSRHCTMGCIPFAPYFAAGSAVAVLGI